MKLYRGYGTREEVAFRVVAVYPEYAKVDGSDIMKPSSVIRLEGYEHQPGSESKACVLLDYEEAQDWIKRLTKAVAEAPCPTCGRHEKK